MRVGGVGEGSVAGAERHAFLSTRPLSAGLEAPKLPLSKPLASQGPGKGLRWPYALSQQPQSCFPFSLL